ncbi:MAG: T9SS type A sorting domain-containing protein [Bacteroidota bacterium]
MNVKVKTILFLALLCSSFNALNAQTCINFMDYLNGASSITLGSQQGNIPGQVIRDSAGIKTTLEETFLLGLPPFGEIQIRQDELRLDGVSLQFDFDLPNEEVTSIQFLHALGGFLNISINGSLPYTNLDPNSAITGPNNLPGDVTMEVSVTNIGQIVTFSAPKIESFLIGGQNAFVRNLCYETQPLINNSTNCLNWQTLSNGAGAFYGETTGYFSGDTIPEINDDVVITLERYPSITGSSIYYGLDILDLALYPAQLDSAALNLNFKTLNPVTQLQFTIYEGDGPVVAAINGQTAVFTDFSNNLAALQFPGYDVAVVVEDYFNTQSYTITISGPNIESFLLGGVHLPLGEFCYSFASTCAIGPISIEQAPCFNNANLLFFDIDFDHFNTSGSFSIVGDGNNYGTFNYNDLPVTISMIPPTNLTVLTFEVIDSEDANCNNINEIEFDDCSFQNCSISNVVAEAGACDANDQVMVQVDFEFSNPGVLGFMVVGDGNFYGTFDYSELPLTLGPFDANGQTPEFNVFDLATPSCIGYIEMEPLSCDSCSLNNLTVEANPCTPNGIFYADLDFDYSQASDSFWVNVDNRRFGPFLYDELPINLGPFAGNGQTVYEFKVSDVEDRDCHITQSLGPIDCGACSIENLEVVVIGCTSNSNSDRTYAIEVDFEASNPNNDVFVLYANNPPLPIRSYRISDLPLTINDFPYQGGTMDALQVCIADSSNILPPSSCCADISFPVPDCILDTCTLSNLTLIPGNCDANGQFRVTVDFDYNSFASDQFMVEIDGSPFGPLAYDQLPVSIGRFDGDGFSVHRFFIYDLADQNCTIRGDVEAPKCSDCEINDLAVYALDCTSDSTYNIRIDFAVSNTISDSFTVYTGGNSLQNMGTYALSDLPLTLPNFINQGLQDMINIRIGDSNLCQDRLLFDAPDCITNDSCQLSNLILEPQPCNPNGLYAVDLDFEYENTSDSFEIRVNGIPAFGPFAYRELPLNIGLFLGNGITQYDLEIVDEELSNCILTGTLFPRDCGTCQIINVVTDPQECTSDTTYNFVLDFDVLDNLSDSFQVFDSYTASVIGNYSINDLPITINGFINRDTQDDILVCVDGSPNCCEEIKIDAPDCVLLDTCRLFNLELEALPCNADGEFFVKVDFDRNDFASDSFAIEVNNDFFGPFGYNELQLELGPLAGNGQGDYEFLVYDYADQNCTITGSIDTVSCGNVCELANLGVELLDCTSDTTYNILIDFEVSNPGNDFFDLFDTWGVLIGSYSINDLPITITNFVTSNNGRDEVKVCIKDNPNCCISEVFDAPDCLDTCSLSNLDVYPIDCNPDGTFSLAINFDPDPSSTEVDVYNGNFYLGTFSTANLPLFLPSFPSSSNAIEEIKVCNANAPNCCLTTTFNPLDCENCEISDLVVTIGNCDFNGEYFVELDFQYQNIGNIGFQVLGNGDDYGNFEYDDLPVQLGPFGPNSPEELEFIVFDLINFNCTASTSIDAPDCMVVECIDFEDQPTNIYTSVNTQPGDTILDRTDGIFATFETFTSSNGNVISDSIEIKDEISRIMAFNEATAKFDFSMLANPSNRVAISVLNRGGELNLAVNDAPLWVGNDFNQLPNEVAPGVFQTFFNLGSLYSLLVLEGPIQSVQIGGVNVQIDNVCYEFMPPAITECIQFETLPCCMMITPNIVPVGSVISVENNIELSYRGGTIRITDNPTDNACGTFTTSQGQYLVLSGEIGIDLDGLGALPQSIEFDFLSCGMGSEISVNGVPFIPLFLADTAYSVTPNVRLSIQLNPNNPAEGFATLAGEIESLLLNGQELGIDHICFDIADNFTTVWPGDTNDDNQANHLDLLNVGLAFGATGPARSNIDTDWQGLQANNWPQYFANREINFKHADTNGDGKIDANDREAILNNYGAVNGPTPHFLEVRGTSDDPPLRVALEQAAPLVVGQPFNAPIILGDTDHQLDGVYGLAFTIRFNPSVIDPNSVRLDVPDQSWLGSTGSDLIEINRSFAANGLIEVAITRTDQEDRSGHGPIAGFIGIIDNIGGKVEAEVIVENVRAINSDEIIIPLYTPISKLQLTTSTGRQPLEQSLRIYPNPARHTLNVLNLSEERIQQIIVHNVIGQQMLRIDLPNAFETIDVSRWTPGVYLLEIRTADKVISKKVEVFHR